MSEHALVERLVSEATGTAVEIVATEELTSTRGSVRRLTLAEPIDGVGATIVVKDRSIDVLGGEFAEVNLRTERAALELIHRVGLDAAPRFICGGHDDGVIVMTDLGTRTVERVLHEHDSEAATKALIELGRTAGRLNSVVSHEGERLIPADDTWTLGSRGLDWPTVVDAVEAVAFPTPRASVADEVDRLVSELRPPAWIPVLAQGDLTPNNAVIGDDGVCRLIDFEGTAFQHLGTDSSMLRFPFAWYGKWALVPLDVRDAMERAYRDEIGREDDEVDRAIAVGCLTMMVFRLERLPRIADEEQPPGAAERRRVQIVTTIDVAVDAAARVGAYPSLRGWLETLASAMRDRWVEATRPPPVFPAFRV